MKERRIQFRRVLRFQRSTLFAQGPLGKVTIHIEGALTTRQRRVIAVSLFQQIKPWLQYFRDRTLFHHEHWPPSDEEQEKRGVRIFAGSPVTLTTGDLGFRIRMRRLALGWSQQDLATRARLNRSHLSLLERGLHDAHGATIKRLEEVLGIVLTQNPTIQH